MKQFNPNPQIFISYSRKDIAFARKLVDRFTSREITAWIDWRGIPPSVEWWKEIEDAIEKSDVFLFLISPDSIASEPCQKEIAHCVRNGKRIVPVVVRDPINNVQEVLAKLNWIFLRENDDFDFGFESLLEAIFTDFEWVKAHGRLQVKALDWERHNGERSLLLRGKDLRDAESLLKAKIEGDPQPTDLQYRYIKKSRQVIRRQQWTPVGLVFILMLFGFIWGRYYFFLLPIARACPAVSQIEFDPEFKGLSPKTENTLRETISNALHNTLLKECKSDSTELIKVSASSSNKPDEIILEITLPDKPAYKLDFLPEIRHFDPEIVSVEEAISLLRASSAYSLGEYREVEILIKDQTSLTASALLAQSYLFLDQLKKSQSAYETAINLSQVDSQINQMLQMGAALAWWRPLINEELSQGKKDEICLHAGKYYSNVLPWSGAEFLILNTRILYAQSIYCIDTFWQTKEPEIDTSSTLTNDIGKFILALRCMDQTGNGASCDPERPLEASQNILKARSLLAQEYLFRKVNCTKAGSYIDSYRHDIINKSDIWELKSLLRYEAIYCSKSK